MRTVANLIAELSKFPPDAKCYAYEGEITGIVVIGDGPRELGCVHCESGDEEDKPTEITGAT